MNCVVTWCCLGDKILILVMNLCIWRKKRRMGILLSCSCTAVPVLSFKIVKMKHTKEAISFPLKQHWLNVFLNIICLVHLAIWMVMDLWLLLGAPCFMPLEAKYNFCGHKRRPRIPSNAYTHICTSICSILCKGKIELWLPSKCCTAWRFIYDCMFKTTHNLLRMNQFAYAQFVSASTFI